MGEKARDLNTFCTQCGTPNPEYEVFCGSCGISMEKRAAPIQAPQFTTPPANTYSGPPPQMYSAPPPQMYPGNRGYGQPSYPIRWQDATKVTIGVLLIIAGLTFGLFGLVFIALDPFIGLILMVLLSVIPTYVGFLLLKSFMGGWDMIKASLSSFIIGFVVYIYGIFVFIFMLFFLFDGYFF